MSAQTDEAIRILKSKSDSAADVETRSLAQFALGAIYLNNAEYENSQKAFFESLNAGTRLDDYAYYFLGESFYRQSNYKEAKRYLTKVIDYKPRSPKYVEARFLLGELSLIEKDFRTASVHFTYLEKKLRRTSKYSTAVLNLIKADMNTKYRHRVCKWMRKLYTSYPSAVGVKEWGIDLHKVTIEGKKPSCIASPNDIKSRIRNLQYAGLSDKAREEIEVLRSRTGELATYYTDNILANFLVNDGHVEDAFKILAPYYKTHEKDYSYLMLLAKASARAGDFQTASGAYFKAYQITPRSRKGREALFQAAFLSYQNQDYDGASIKFGDFLKKFASSGLSRDAKWYLAWIAYLKSDYNKAYDLFSDLSTKGRRAKRMTYTVDRINYWRAMSLMKAGKINESKLLFEKTASDKLYGYYALAAQARLETLKEEIHKRGLASAAVSPEIVAESSAVGPIQSLTGTELIPTEQPSAADAESGEATQAKEVKSEEEEAESGLQLAEEDSDEENAEEASDEAQVVTLPEEDAENPLKTSFKDPRLMSRFKRASDLSQLGFQDWAKFELWEIERRTRNKDYLKMLMSEYEATDAYNRSSSIAQEEFASQRSKMGIDKSKYLWQFAYPKAFEKTVSNFSRSFRVQQEFVWSIMRAESRYKPDVVSPVGAMGLMQLMPYTAENVARILQIQGFRVPQLTEPEMNIRLGTRYLSRLNQKLNSQIPLVAAAYNAGPHRVAAWLKSFGKLELDEFIEHIPFFETRNYVKKVVHNYFVYTQLYTKEPKKTLTWLTQPVGVELDGPIPTKENWDDI